MLANKDLLVVSHRSSEFISDYFVFLSLWLSDQTSESNQNILYFTYSCNFFCVDIKIVALKSFFFVQETKVLLVSFCVLEVTTRALFFANNNSFRHGAQPTQLSQSDHSEGQSDHCLDQEFTMNSGGSSNSTKEAKVGFSAKTTREIRYNYQQLSSMSEIAQYGNLHAHQHVGSPDVKHDSRLGGCEFNLPNHPFLSP